MRFRLLLVVLMVVGSLVACGGGGGGGESDSDPEAQQAARDGNACRVLTRSDVESVFEDAEIGEAVSDNQGQRCEYAVSGGGADSGTTATLQIFSRAAYASALEGARLNDTPVESLDDLGEEAVAEGDGGTIFVREDGYALRIEAGDAEATEQLARAVDAKLSDG